MNIETFHFYIDHFFFSVALIKIALLRLSLPPVSLGFIAVCLLCIIYRECNGGTEDGTSLSCNVR